VKDDRDNPGVSGMTLIEVSMAVAVLTALTIAVGALTQTAARATNTSMRTQQVDEGLTRALDQLAHDVGSASRSGTVIDSSGSSHDRVSLQLSSAELAGTGQEWGYRDANAVFQTDWLCTYSVENSNLVMTVTDAFDHLEYQRTLCAEVDDFDGESKGFLLTRVNDLVIITLRTRGSYSDGGQRTRTVSTTVLQLLP